VAVAAAVAVAGGEPVAPWQWASRERCGTAGRQALRGCSRCRPPSWPRLAALGSVRCPARPAPIPQPHQGLGLIHLTA
jgi:hypothetical protein